LTDVVFIIHTGNITPFYKKSRDCFFILPAALVALHLVSEALASDHTDKNEKKLKTKKKEIKRYMRLIGSFMRGFALKFISINLILFINPQSCGASVFGNTASCCQ
jgi:hypothetical protein